MKNSLFLIPTTHLCLKRNFNDFSPTEFSKNNQAYSTAKYNICIKLVLFAKKELHIPTYTHLIARTKR